MAALTPSVQVSRFASHLGVASRRRGAGEMTNGQTAAGHAEPANRMKTEESSCDNHDCALS
jgi:hypothetical protein